MRDPALVKLFERRNAVRDVAAACHISTSAVAQWTKVPWLKREVVAAALGVALNDLPVGSPRAGAGLVSSPADEHSEDVNLAEAIRRRMAKIGWFDFEGEPPCPIREPPSFIE